MNPNVLGLLLTLLLILVCMGGGFLASKKYPELARKIVHIGVCHWYLIYRFCFTGPLLSYIGLAAFAGINAFFNLSGLLEKLLGQKGKKNWGLVWYPLALLIMLFLCEHGIGDITALGCAALGLGYGDGLAALAGKRFGKRAFTKGKTWAGSLTVFIMVTLVSFLLSKNLPMSLLCGLTGMLTEAFTPYNLDNFSVPFSIYAVAALWSAYV